MKKFLLIPFIGLMLAACGVDSGTIYAKTYVAPYDEPYQHAVYRQDCGPHYEYTYDGKYRLVNSCKQVLSHYEQRYEHHDACWKIMFQNTDGDKGESCVPQSTYDDLEVGDFYSKDGKSGYNG